MLVGAQQDGLLRHSLWNAAVVFVPTSDGCSSVERRLGSYEVVCWSHSVRGGLPGMMIHQQAMLVGSSPSNGEQSTQFPKPSAMTFGALKNTYWNITLTQRTASRAN